MQLQQLTLNISPKALPLHEFPTMDAPWVCRTIPSGNYRPGIARHSTWGAAMVRALAILNESPGFYKAVEVRRYG